MKQKILYTPLVIVIAIATSLMTRFFMSLMISGFQVVSYRDWVLCSISPLVILFFSKNIKVFHYLIIPFLFTIIFSIVYNLAIMY